MIRTPPLVQALRALRPDADFAVHDDGLGAPRLEWHGPGSQPSKSEIAAAIQALLAPVPPTDKDRLIAATGLDELRLKAVLESILAARTP